jgi:Zn-dependent metalloprotease
MVTEVELIFDVLTSIDVAHEIGHAVCEKQQTAYQKESGAMNEAFSDIWGLYRILQHLENLLG